MIEHLEVEVDRGNGGSVEMVCVCVSVSGGLVSLKINAQRVCVERAHTSESSVNIRTRCVCQKYPTMQLTLTNGDNGDHHGLE